MRNDPRAFLEEITPPVIFDEIQNVPELFDYVRTLIDARSRRMGQWLFTGSQEAPLMHGITESMAGRAAILQLLPFSVSETSKVNLLYGGFPEVLARRKRAPCGSLRICRRTSNAMFAPLQTFAIWSPSGDSFHCWRSAWTGAEQDGSRRSTWGICSHHWGVATHPRNDGEDHPCATVFRKLRQAHHQLTEAVLGGLWPGMLFAQYHLAERA